MRPFTYQVISAQYMPSQSSSNHHSPHPKKPIFNFHKDQPHPMSQYDARDAYDACSDLTGNHKKECYVSFGVDGDSVEKYLPVVEYYEKMLNRPPYKKNKDYTVWEKVMLEFNKLYVMLK